MPGLSSAKVDLRGMRTRTRIAKGGGEQRVIVWFFYLIVILFNLRYWGIFLMGHKNSGLQ